MPSQSPEPLTKATFRVYEIDLIILRRYHTDGQINAVVREVLRSYCRKLEVSHTTNLGADPLT